MVRIKHRYLLIDILFPPTSNSTSSASSRSPKPSCLLFNSPTPSHFQAGSLLNLIRESVAELFGDYGIGAIAGLKIVYFSPATSTAIVRCPRASYRLVWAGLTFASSLPGARKGARVSTERLGCVIRVVRVSGTIRKAEEEAVRRARREIVRVKMLEDAGGAGTDVDGLDVLLRFDQGGDSSRGCNEEDIRIGDISDTAASLEDDSG